MTAFTPQRRGSAALSILRRLFAGMGLGGRESFIILLLIFGSPSEKRASNREYPFAGPV